MFRFFRALLIAAILSQLGCSTHPSKTLEQVTLGMDKGDVIEIAGGPTRKFREEGQDHWIYVYYIREQQWMREFVLEDGRVTKIKPPVAKEVKEPWQQELEATQTMEEFEAKAREQQKKKSSKSP